MKRNQNHQAQGTTDRERRPWAYDMDGLPWQVMGNQNAMFIGTHDIDDLLNCWKGLTAEILASHVDMKSGRMDAAGHRRMLRTARRMRTMLADLEMLVEEDLVEGKGD